MEMLILLGGLTTHPFSPSFIQDRYKNHLGNGIISNPYAGLMIGSDIFKTGILLGKDSVNGTIYGSISQFKLHNNISFVFGGYNYNKNIYKDRGLTSPNFRGITPIVGLDLNFELYKGKGYTIESHNILSGITTHSIGIKFKFE